MAPTLADGPHRTALVAVRALVRRLSHSARAVEARTGLTNAQLFLLREVEREDGLSVNELARRAHTTQGTVSSILRRLTLSGLVRRDRSPDDGRRAELVLTPAARRLLRRAPSTATSELIEALRDLSAGEARALVRGLRALARRLDLPLRDAPMLFEQSGRKQRP